MLGRSKNIYRKQGMICRQFVMVTRETAISCQVMMDETMHILYLPVKKSPSDLYLAQNNMSCSTGLIGPFYNKLLGKLKLL